MATSYLKTTVSVIIPFFNQVKTTEQCLQSLSSVSEDVTYEIILVDDGSTEPYSFKNNSLIKLVKNEQNLGFARSCNRGAAYASSEYLVFLNNDTIARNGWLDELVNTLMADPQFGVAGCKLLYCDNTVQHAGITVDEQGMPFHIYHRFPEDFTGVNKTRLFQAVTGACFIIKKELFQLIGGFDERYRNGFEDIDLCLRVQEAGFKVVYSSQSCLYHLESKTLRTCTSNYMDNLALFKEKWAGKLLRDYQQYFQADLANENEFPDPFQYLIERRKNGQPLKVGIWGAGGGGRHMAVMLGFMGIRPDFFIDSDPKKWGTALEGILIYNPDYLCQLKQQKQPMFILVASLYFNEIHTVLRNFGFEPIKEFW